MAAETEYISHVDEVDQALQSWRQGDCVLGEHWFVYRVDPLMGLTQAAEIAAQAGTDLAEIQVAGLVVVTQTCDLVRSCIARPYVEVCPLVHVDNGVLREIERGRRPGYAFLPRLVEQRLVADLDRVMTVEKSVVKMWARTPSLTTDAEIRCFSQALARKRVRFAFPDDFTLLVKKLQERLIDKHDKNSPEGRGLRALVEIRVQASPSWDANSVQIVFWFIRKGQDMDFEGKNWADLVNAWLQLVQANGRFTTVEGAVKTLEDLTAADYVQSDPLDLDHLTLQESA